jgi:hypothetical protein
MKLEEEKKPLYEQRKLIITGANTDFTDYKNKFYSHMHEVEKIVNDTVSSKPKDELKDLKI